VFITINFYGSINKIEENWEKPTFFIQDGGYLFTNLMSGAARLPALMVVTGAVLVENLEGRSQVLLGVVVARVAHHHRQELRELDHPAP